MKTSPSSALAKQLPGLAEGLFLSLHALKRAPDPSLCEEVVIQLECVREHCLMLAGELNPKHPQWRDATDLAQRLREHDSVKGAPR